MNQRQSTQFDYILQFDGGASPNPGRGYGSFEVRDGDGNLVLRSERIQFPGRVTNNQAEYMTLIAALEGFLAYLGAEDVFPEDNTICISGDPELIMKQMRGEYKVRKPELMPLNQKVRSLAGRFKQVAYRWRGRAKSVELFGH